MYSRIRSQLWMETRSKHIPLPNRNDIPSIIFRLRLRHPRRLHLLDPPR